MPATTALLLFDFVGGFFAVYLLIVAAVLMVLAGVLSHDAGLSRQPHQKRAT